MKNLKQSFSSSKVLALIAWKLSRLYSREFQCTQRHQRHCSVSTCWKSYWICLLDASLTSKVHVVIQTLGYRNSTAGGGCMPVNHRIDFKLAMARVPCSFTHATNQNYDASICADGCQHHTKLVDVSDCAVFQGESEYNIESMTNWFSNIFNSIKSYLLDYLNWLLECDLLHSTNFIASV